MRVGQVLALAAAFGGLAPESARAQNGAPATPAAPAPGNERPLTLQGPGPGQGGGERGATRPGAIGGRPTLTAVRATQPPTVDGRLDDSIWLSAGDGENRDSCCV